MEGGNTPLPNTPQVQAMRKCGMTEDEIFDVLRTDKEIDQGAKLFELAEELKAGAKKARRADRTDTPKPRTRAPNIDKQYLLSLCFETLGYNIDGELEMVNPEREFLFTHNGTKYKVVLSCPRT